MTQLACGIGDAFNKARFVNFQKPLEILRVVVTKFGHSFILAILGKCVLSLQRTKVLIITHVIVYNITHR